MGRRIPSTAISSSINPAFSISLLAASVAVMIAVIGALCAARSRKPASPVASPSKTREESETIDQQNTATAAQSSSNPNSPDDSNSKAFQEQQFQPSSNNFSTKPKRKLSSSLSMKIQPGNSLAKFKSRKEETDQPKKDKSVKDSSKQEDSLWSKTIILGEKCKVPNEESAIIYDQKGKRIAAYPARTPRSLPVSRTHSLIDQDYNL